MTHEPNPDTPEWARPLKPGEYPCQSGKVQHETKEGAKTQARVAGRAGHSDRGQKNTTYKCDYCGFWHIGRRRR